MTSLGKRIFYTAVRFVIDGHLIHQIAINAQLLSLCHSDGVLQVIDPSVLNLDYPPS